MATVVEDAPPPPVELPPGSWTAPPVRTGPLAEAVTAIPPEPAHDAIAAGKRRSWKLIITVLVVMIVLIGGGVAITMYVMATEEDRRAKQAQEDYTAGLYAKSEDEFRKLLEKFPNSVHVPEYEFMADLCEVRRLGQQLVGSDFRQDMTQIAAFLQKHKDNPLMQEYLHDVGETYVKLVRDMVKDVAPQPGPAVGGYMDAAKETLGVMSGNLAAAVSPADRAEIDRQFEEIRARFNVAVKKREDLERITQQPPTISGIRAAEEIIKSRNLQEDPEARALVDELYQKHFKSVIWGPAPPVADAGAKDLDTEPTLLVGPLLTERPLSGRRDDPIVLVLSRGVLYALRQSDGDIRWFMRVGVDTTTLPVLIPPSPPWVLELLFLVQSADSRSLTAFDAKGRSKWTCNLSAPALGRPVVVKNRAYIATYDGHVYEIELAEGGVRGRFDLGEGVKLSVGGVHEPNTNLVYFPADEWCVFVLDVENHTCAKVLYTKHPSGSLRSEPIIASWTEREAGQKAQLGFLFLTLADELDSMQLRAYALPVENPRAEQIPMNPKPQMNGWAWFAPHQDAEKIAIISDEGRFGLYGIRQKRTDDNPLFPLAPLDVSKQGHDVDLLDPKRNFLLSNKQDKDEVPEANAPPAKGKWRGRSLVAYAAEEDEFWVLTYGKLQRLRLLMTTQGPLLLKAWEKPVDLGSALHASQVYDFSFEQGGAKATTLMLVTQPLNRQMCVATAVDAETGAVRWQRQLGIVSRGEPLPFGGGVLALDQSGGAFWFDPQKLRDKEQAGRGQKLGDALDDGETPPVLLAGLNGQSAYELAIPTPAPGANSELIVRVFHTNGGELPTVNENRIRLDSRVHIDGTLSINPSGILVPLSNGEVVRVALDGKTITEGPPWRPSWEDASLHSFTTWTSEKDLLTTNGRNGLLRWEWTPGKSDFRTVPDTRKEDESTLDMPSRIVTAPLAVPVDGGGLRVLVACADRTLYLVDGTDVATAMKTKEGLRVVKERKWSMPGEITAGPFFVGQNVYVIVERNRLFRIDLNAPALGPEYKCEGEAIIGQPQLIEGMLVVADQSGRFVGLDPLTLKPHGQGYKMHASVGPAASPVAFGPDLAFAPLTDGTVLLLSLAQLRQP